MVNSFVQALMNGDLTGIRRCPKADLHNHCGNAPIRKLYDAGVKVTVNTDDALVFGPSVSEEFLGLYRAGVFRAEELDEIRLNGLTD